ncbi:MAG: hypothetical protein MSJ26_04700 [Oscillospiraceae bacterium]|nr:hypothetical protein [Oscillospiraceae bacterium]
MKRKAVCAVLSFNFLLMAAGCDIAKNEPVPMETSAPEASSPITEKIPDTETISQTITVTETTSVTEAPPETAVSESEPENSETTIEESIPEEIFTEEDIFIYSFDCGYISQDNKPPNGILVIETDEQLSFAEDRYGLAVPADLPKSDEWWYDKEIAEAFQEMKADYPLSKYSYAVCYDEVNCGGYYLHADKLIKKGDLLYFGMDNESYTPSYDELTPQVEGGFCHMAAFPKSLFEDMVFSNAVYPDKNELTQDINYLFRLEYDIADKSLFDAYGGDVFLIESQEEYEEFVKQTEQYLTGNIRTEKYTTGSERINLPMDFEKVTAAVCFFTNEYKHISFHNNGVIISEGKVSFDYNIEADSYDDTKKPKPMTCMIYAAIPKRFLE